MSRQLASAGGRADAAEVRQELLGRLGVRGDASDADVEAAHTGLVEFLELAPNDMKAWASSQTADVDEAFALLSGPEQDLVPASQSTWRAEEGLPGKASAGFSPAPAAPRAPAAPASLASKPPWIKMIWVAVPVLVIAIVFAVFQMGKSNEVPGINGTPTGTETTAAAGGPTAAPVDKAKVAALMTKVSANPKDVVSLQALGTLYFVAGDYKTASTWAQKVLRVDPTNKTALISIGAAQFNVGDQAEAKKNWLVAAKLYPKEAEVHYDLGFLYMSQTPPDLVNQKIEWAKVVAIDPTSQLAKSVQTHVSGTKTPAASATPTK